MVLAAYFPNLKAFEDYLDLVARAYPEQKESMDYLRRYTGVWQGRDELFSFDFTNGNAVRNEKYCDLGNPFALDFQFEYFMDDLQRLYPNKAAFLAGFSLRRVPEEWPQSYRWVVRSPLALLKQIKDKKSTLIDHHSHATAVESVNFVKSQVSDRPLDGPLKERFEKMLENTLKLVNKSPTRFAIRAAALQLAMTDSELEDYPEALELIQFAAAYNDPIALGMLARQCVQKLPQEPKVGPLQKVPDFGGRVRRLCVHKRDRNQLRPGHPGLSAIHLKGDGLPVHDRRNRLRFRQNSDDKPSAGKPVRGASAAGNAAEDFGLS